MLHDRVINFELAKQLRDSTSLFQSNNTSEAKKQSDTLSPEQIFGGYFENKSANSFGFCDDSYAPFLDGRAENNYLFSNFMYDPHNNADSSSGVEVSEELLDKFNNVDRCWKIVYKDYTPTDLAKYNKVKNFVEKYAKKQRNTTANAEILTNMICKLSDDYGIDPEITAAILAHESGGFLFTPGVMSKRKNYKGVTQVSYTMVKVLYASYDDRKNMSLTFQERVEANSHRHCTQDEKRIAEIKAIYPTPQDLWKALEKDVSLGVEVGIMVFKAKLNANKGDTREALSSYCGGQYRLPYGTSAKMFYSLPLQEYNNLLDERNS